MASSKISLKLLVNNKTKKCGFGLQSADAPDRRTMHGSVGRDYCSVEHIGASYLQPGIDWSDLLQPKVLHPDARKVLLMQGGANGEPVLARLRLYMCTGYATTFVEEKAMCPQCKQAMAMEVAIVTLVQWGRQWQGCRLRTRAAGASRSGNLHGDRRAGGDAHVGHLSSITMINKFTSGKDVELTEKFVSIGMNEVLASGSLYC